MARRKYLFRSEGYALPSPATLTKIFHCLRSPGAVLSASGNQLGNRLAMPRNGNGFSPLDFPEQFG